MLNKTSPPDKQETVQQDAVQDEWSESLEESKDIELTSSSSEPLKGVPNGVSGTEQEWKQKCQVLQDQLTRLAADFDNYRKRVRDEQSSLIKYGAQKSITELLPVLDNLDRATKSLTEDSDAKVLFKSFSVIEKQLKEGLSAIGAQKIDCLGKPFDPQFHEALNRMSSPDVPENNIMHEVQSGYQLHDKVIRPAQVIVSMGNPDANDAGASDDNNNPFVG